MALRDQFEQIRSRVAEQLGPRLDQIREFYDKLERREKLIVNVLVGFIAVLIVYSIIAGLFDSLSQYERKIQDTLKTARKVESVMRVIADSKRKIDRYERLLARRGSNFSITAFLEREAQKKGLQIKNVSQPKFEDLGNQVSKISVSVDMESNAQLGAIIDFLGAIERSPNLLRVSQLNIKPRFDDPQKLEVSFTTDTFDFIEEEKEAKE